MPGASSTRKRSYTKAEVVTLLQNASSDSDIEDSSSAAETGSDSDLASADSDDSTATLDYSLSDDFAWSTAVSVDRKRFDFKDNAGLQIVIADEDDPLAYFEQFFTPSIVDRIVLETNRRAEQLRQKSGVKPRSRLNCWSSTSPAEIHVFLAVLMYQGIVWKPELAMYWSTNPLLETPYIRRIMSEQRFSLLMKCLHFVNNEDLPAAGTSAEKSLNKIKPLFDSVVDRFSAVYTPCANVAVDESLMLWKGRLAMKQYIPIKRARFGLKSYLLCESGSGYIWKVMVHIGPAMDLEPSDDGLKSSQIVLTLAKDLLDQGYCIYMDNWYSSPKLFKQLHQRKTDAVGTVRIARRNMPNDLKNNVDRGHTIARYSGNLMALKWKDKKDVVMLSTYHDDRMTTVSTYRGEKEKPEVVVEYNRHMGAVDVADQMMVAYPVERKRKKVWYKKLFEHLLNQTLLNCYLLFKKQNPGSKCSHIDFRLQLITRLLAEHHNPAELPRRGRPSHDLGNPLRLTERHFPKILAPNDGKANPTRKCKVCCSHTDKDGKKTRKETRYYCANCDVALCVTPCFELYHTKRTV